MKPYHSFEEENIGYWTKRTPGYSTVNQEELASTQHTVWGDLLVEHISAHYPERKPQEIRVLDIGTGPGFFAIILAERGYAVTGVDYTATMLEAAKQNAGALEARIQFVRMDAEALTFSDNSFDVVVSRNLTWNLHKPDMAYRHWNRVLKTGGLLLNFDANWYSYLHDEDARKGHFEDRKNIVNSNVRDETAGTDVDAMEAIALQTPLSACHRPNWDLKHLRHLGMCASADKDIWKRVWTLEERINNASTPMFLIKAVKLYDTATG